ncbi:MAG: flavin reductase family protein [Thermoanaerobaculia bacterium]|nr:flavin reductase family protein [Thermoanaerobaculia bacterium]
MRSKPQDLDITERYKLLIGCIVPRPIAFVSTVSATGVANVAPFSFFSGVGSNPMTLLFCPGNAADGSEKDTLRNAKPVAEGGGGDFVVNLAREDYVRQVVAAAEILPPEESEFTAVGLTEEESEIVRSPRVAESPVAFECRTLQVIRTNPGRPAGGNVVLGEVVYVHIDDELLDDRMRVDPARLRAVGRMGGAGYSTTRDRFEIPRGLAALEVPDPFGEL